ncbi:unnamed protein product [Ectocarpus sp. 8 AP-2014]
MRAAPRTSTPSTCRSSASTQTCTRSCLWMRTTRTKYVPYAYRMRKGLIGFCTQREADMVRGERQPKRAGMMERLTSYKCLERGRTEGTTSLLGKFFFLFITI